MDVARRHLLHFLATSRIPNPVVLTGAINSNWVNDLKVDFDTASGRNEPCGVAVRKSVREILVLRTRLRQLHCDAPGMSK